MLPLIFPLSFLLSAAPAQHQLAAEAEASSSNAHDENTNMSLIPISNPPQGQPPREPFHLAHHLINHLKARFGVEQPFQLHPPFSPVHRLQSPQASNEKPTLQLQHSTNDSNPPDLNPTQDLQIVPATPDDNSLDIKPTSLIDSEPLLASAFKDLRVEIGILLFQLLSTSLASRFPQLQGILKHAGEVLPLVITRVSEMRAKGVGGMAGQRHPASWAGPRGRRWGLGVA
ncbi:hypothetical protein BP6252_04589 [Coleophoma cylindrospora]|uniref:Aflatoxin regulatory protein domain-containing protein n=1 Tax=Coleophoma cylindrospora TaxID=1849047 RepID=A0A3D8S1I9_9HELO|nr:hypothetical protein BP6252_04589 [Coleophoma cylindrospora]